jgi:hypothetical protein
MGIQGFTKLRQDLTSVFVMMLVVLLAPESMAQTATSGTLIGTVTDATGAVVPNADVQLVNNDTNATFNQKTNGAGQYVFPNVTPGDYKITVKVAGFRTAAVPSLTVEVNKSYSMPITLEVGAESQVVEVRPLPRLSCRPRTRRSAMPFPMTPCYACPHSRAALPSSCSSSPVRSQPLEARARAFSLAPTVRLMIRTP